MWSTGAAGIFVTIVVLAIPAFIGAVYGDSSTACYSVMCGILFLPLLFVGACFATIAVGLRYARCFVLNSHPLALDYIEVGSVSFCRKTEHCWTDEEMPQTVPPETFLRAQALQ
jgi:hypothetical protein